MLLWVFSPSLSIRGAPKIAASASPTRHAIKMGVAKGLKALCDGKESAHHWMTDDERLKMAAKMLEAMDSNHVLPLGFLASLTKESGRDPSTITRLYRLLRDNDFPQKKLREKEVKDLQASINNIRRCLRAFSLSRQ